MVEQLPSVGVSVLTYNHAPYIAETLTAILGQKLDYPIVVHVSDDGSTDGTVEILRKFEKKHPAILNVHFQEQRLGMKANFMWTINRCRSKYIALCDGDDLWTDPKKLQKQVDQLEKNPDASTCFHVAEVLNRNGNQIVSVPRPHQLKKTVYTADDLVKFESFFATSSIMFRRPTTDIFPDWFKHLSNQVDFPLNMINALRGPLILINETMSIYRSNSGVSSYSARDTKEIYSEAIQMFELMRKYLPDKYDDAFLRKQCRNHAVIVAMACAQGDTALAEKSHLELVRIAGLVFSRGYSFDVAVFLKVKFLSKCVPISIRKKVMVRVAHMLENR